MSAMSSIIGHSCNRQRNIIRNNTKIVTSYSQDPTPLRQGTVMGKGVTLCKSRFKVKSVGRSSLDETLTQSGSQWKLRLCAQNLCVMNLMSVCMLMAVVPGMQISSGVVPSIRN